MRQSVERAVAVALAILIGLACVVAILASAAIVVAFRLLRLAIVTAPLWGFGLIALWIVGII